MPRVPPAVMTPEQAYIVTGRSIGVHGDHPHQHKHGADEAAGDAPEGADE